MRKKPQPASRTDAFSPRDDRAGRTVLVGSSSIRALNGATPMPSCVVMSVRKNSVTEQSTPPVTQRGYGVRRAHQFSDTTALGTVESRWGQDLSLIHISEPTRLGMISYAVFCLKK